MCKVVEICDRYIGQGITVAGSNGRHSPQSLKIVNEITPKLLLRWLAPLCKNNNLNLNRAS